jgi:hypothetical protein
MLPVLIPWFSSGLLAFFLFVLAHVATTIAGWEAINGRHAGLGSVLGRAIRRPFWMSLLQTLILIGILFFAAMVVGIIAFPFAKSNPDILPWVMLAIALLVYAYPLVATLFRVQKVAIEHRGPWKGMIASVALVKGNWWRTFAILLLFMVASTALTSLVGVALGNRDVFNFGNMTADPDQQAATAIRLKEMFTWSYILISSIFPAITLTFLFYLLTPMYVDLRARRGEFVEGDDFEEGDDFDD